MTNPWKVTYIVLLCATPFAMFGGLVLFFIVHARVQAKVWHSAHGDMAHTPDYNIRVPHDWWQDDITTNDAGQFKSITLRRVDIEDTSMIVINKVDPKDVTPAASVEQLLKDITVTVNEQNKHDHRESSHMVRLDQGDVKLYCFTEMPNGVMHLTCRAPRSPYIFLYSGDPRYESEAEKILGTLQLAK